LPDKDILSLHNPVPVIGIDLAGICRIRPEGNHHLIAGKPDIPGGVPGNQELVYDRFEELEYLAPGAGLAKGKSKGVPSAVP